MPANINSMAYAGEVPWHGLGARLQKRMTTQEALEKGGLDWEVELKELRTESDAGQFDNKLEEHRAVVRKDNSSVLGVVGTSYVPLQNKEAFSFFDHAITDRKAIFETVGALGKGERVWMLAKVEGKDFDVLPSDKVEPYLLLFHAHDGSACVTSLFTPIRVVCQNTLRAALSKNSDRIKIRHTGDVAGKIRLAGDAIRLVGTMIDETKPVFIKMAQKQLNHSKTEEYVAKVLRPNVDTGDKEQTARLKSNIEEIMGLVEAGQGSDIQGVRGTVWGAYNAITEFVDHKRSIRGGEQNRIGSIWLGQGSQIKQRAFSIGATLSGVKEVALLN